MDNRFARQLFRCGRLNPKEIDAYLEQMDAFRRKFGREMGPDDPFFFDPDADTPCFRPPDDAEYALERVAELMEQAGMDAAHVYAFRQTGLLPPGMARLTPAQLEEWEQAVAEFHRRAS